MRTLLVNPPELERTSTHGGMPPLGLLGIASLLEDHGHTVRVLDLEAKRISIRPSLEEFEPNLVEISGTTHSRFESFKLAQEVKKHDRTIPVVYGGCHATFTDEDTLGSTIAIDYIVRGEGEYTMLDLVNCLEHQESSPHNVKGLSWRDDGRITRNPDRERIRDLDRLPRPARHLLDMGEYDLRLDHINVRATAVMSSRGCPFSCSFCSASKLWGSGYTRRSAKDIVDEIEVLLSQGYEGIKFFDSTLTVNREHVYGLCEEIMKRKLTFPWECEIRVDTVDYDMLKTMRGAGCYYCSPGIESANQRVLDEGIGKRIEIEQAEQVLLWLKRLGYKTKVFFTIGHPTETYEEALCTIGFIKKWRKSIDVVAARFGIFVYPGTRVEEYAKEIGCLPEDWSWSRPYCNPPEYRQLSVHPSVPILTQPQMGFSELRRLYMMELRQRITPRFMLEKTTKLKSIRDLKGMLNAATGILRLMR